jgi:cellulose synthase operon protein C
LAGATIEARRFDEARVAYERLHEASAEDASVLNNLAGLYVLANDPRALDLAEQAHRLPPKAAATLDTLGWALLRTGDVDKAMHHLRDAHTRAASDPTMLYHLAVALNMVGRTDEARKELEAALAKGEDFIGVADAQQLLAEMNGQ